jgi:iron complex outermembrane recepter protein
MKNLLLLTLFMAFAHNSFAQKTLSGKITNENGQSISGASLYIKNSMDGTLTDLEGQYQLSLPEKESTLIVRAVGFETQEIFVGSKTTLDVRMTMAISALAELTILGDEIFTYATRANKLTPTTFSNISNEKIKERNIGLDLPMLLSHTPSMVTTSDAGAGIGYTGMRIRGSDATRINVTLNGIPINDSESHGVYWVNMPDLASSLNKIQIQRGVGTSSNGAAAFGATVNMQSSGPSEKAFVQIDNSFGSFNSWKSTVQFNTGMINKYFNFEGRLSKIKSDGYIDRSNSDLSSYFLTGGYYGEKTTLKTVVFGGQEETYQSWYGTPEARLSGDTAALQAVIDNSGEYNTLEDQENLLNSDRRFNYYRYENEIDHYGQDHFQLHLNHSFNQHLNFVLSGHYTHGAGYYEQYRTKDALANYGLTNLTIGDSSISQTDLIRRRWLDNDFYGVTYAVNYESDVMTLTLGGAYNIYEGAHFGEIIWSEFSSTAAIRERYYDGNSIKNDFNLFLKSNYRAAMNLNLFGDLQVRTIDYRSQGIDNDLSPYDVTGSYVFFNPKVGLTYAVDPSLQLYSSFAIGNREPVRTDFIDAVNGKTPQSERLQNLELGIRGKANTSVFYEANFYLMDYKNQLILTGAVNDVGSSIRVNTPDSYRAGIELVGGISLSENWLWNLNAAFSQNKIKTFSEIVYDYAFDDRRFIVENTFKNTDIAFSPNVILGSDLIFSLNGFSGQWLTKWVGDQYLDNTSNEERKIASYCINDIRLTYEFQKFGMQKIAINLLINNFMNVTYESNGYTWGYLYDGFRYQQNNYYPQSGIHFLSGVSLKF